MIEYSDPPYRQWCGAVVLRERVAGRPGLSHEAVEDGSRDVDQPLLAEVLSKPGDALKLHLSVPRPPAGAQVVVEGCLLGVEAWGEDAAELVRVELWVPPAHDRHPSFFPLVKPESYASCVCVIDLA